MARRAPFQLRVLGEFDGREIVAAELRLLVLKEVERQIPHLKVGIFSEHLESVLARAERVHKQQREAGASLLSSGEHLFDDDLEEALALANREERLRAIHAHRGAKPTIEVDDNELRESILRNLGINLDIGESIHLGQWRDRLFRDRTGHALLELVVKVAEDVNGSFRHARLAHFLLSEGESGGIRVVVVTHAPRIRRFPHKKS